ncbi:MAG: sensor histidine kinase, partial [Desulfuromonadales bacterium]
VTYRVIAGGNAIRHIMAHGRIVRDENGQALRLDGLVEDITERKRAEAEREALIRQLQDKTAELERFVYTVSHDLKSPLVTITGFVGFLEEDFASRNEERFRGSLSRISQAALRMRQLLDELLEFSRIGIKRNPAEIVNLGTLVAQAIDSVSGRLSEVGAIVKVAPELPEVLVDPQGFLQVFENLIDNAATFARDATGGPRIHIGVSQDYDGLVCRVTDNGIGIEPRYANKVFDLFEKLDPHSSGTGVGLAIVKRIIEAHEGKIWIEPTGSGEGTTFCFTLPAV